MRLEYIVIRPFAAEVPISGARKQFVPGDRVLCDAAQGGPVVTVEIEGAPCEPFLVERIVFEASCTWKPSGPVFG
jgi:hypothetical protein